MRALAVLLLGAAPLFAQAHDPYPADFTVPPCAPSNSCLTFSRDKMPAAAFSFLGLQLDADWVTAHGDAVVAAMDPACRRHAACLAVPGNTFMFCDDVLNMEVEPLCDRLFPRGTDAHDWNECAAFRNTLVLGVDQRIDEVWKQMQPCVEKNAVAHTKPLEIWMEPPTIPANFDGSLQIFALDPDTHLPIFARIHFDGQNVYARAAPAGRPVTFYPINYKLQYVRVPNSQGHTDLVPPMITVTTPAYPDVNNAPPYPVAKFRLAAAVPKLVVGMSPETLHKGSNRVMISAHDAATGTPVEMRVMVGPDAIGNSNEPLTIDLARSGHHPEIWLTSLYNKYSDVVIAPAE